MLKKADKIELTKKLAKDIINVEGFAICAFQGIAVLPMNKLRRELFSLNARVQVVKNRLLKHALSDNKIKDMDECLKESTMIILAKEDSMAVFRILGSFAKENPQFSFKIGMISQVKYSKEEMIEISKLPGRIDVIAMIVGGLNSVLSMFNGTLEALEEKKG